MKSRARKQYRTLAVLSLHLTLASCGGGSSTASTLTRSPVSPTPVATSSPGSVAVSVSPASVILAQRSTLQFNATVTGSGNSGVSWGVQESTGGSITNGGLYTAPATDGAFHIVATSQADPTKTAIATVTIVLALAGNFAGAGTMAIARAHHSATLLPDGRVLVAGGVNEDRGNLVTLSSAELFDPTTGLFSSAGGMNHPRGFHTATLLNNGTVLITGGNDAAGAVNTAEIYNPATGSFGLASNLLAGRFGHTATKLKNGTVLLAGGSVGGNSQQALDTAEIYDPATGSFASAGRMRTPRLFHSANLLPSGQVLVAGGYVGGTSTQATSDAELYDPSADTFFVTGSMTSARGWFVAAVLLDGTVLVAGGDDGSGAAKITAEIYVPSMGRFLAAGAMNIGRSEFAGVTLQDGTVLLGGGNGFVVAAELFRPGTGTFEVIGTMLEWRWRHTATLLADGRVLVSGGWNSDGIVVSSAELYKP